MLDLYHAAISDPLYNALVGLTAIMPGEEVALAVIALTVIVRIFLFPLTQQAIKTQVGMKRIAPELERIKEEFKDDQQEQVRRTFALYKENNVRPFFSILALFIQLPIIIGLYRTFVYGGLPMINPELLYSFIPVPDAPVMIFLGFIDMGGRSLLIALVAGATQFVYSRLSIQKPEISGKGGFKDDLAKSFHFQMRYMFPILVVVLSYSISSAVALYWAVGNLVSIAQELLVLRKIRDTQ